MIMVENPIDTGSSAHDILRLLFELGPQKQSQLAARLQVSVAACNRQFKKLAEENLIVGVASASGGSGRPSQMWRIHTAANGFLGLLFYDGLLSAMLVDFDAKPLWVKQMPVRADEGRDALLAKLLGLAEIACRQAAEFGCRILQSFLGIPGLMTRDGMVANAANFPALNGLYPEREIENRFSLRCFADAMHYAFVLSETKDLSPESTALVLDWCDGLGGLVVSNRQLLHWPAVHPRRPRGIWNLGHIRVEADGRSCHCGDRGCLEAYVGGLALRERHPELDCDTDRDLARLAADGDARATALLRDAARRMARTLYWPVELFGVDTVIFTGTLSGAFPRYVDAFREGLGELLTPEELLEIEFVAHDDPERNFCWGAALMARQFYFYPKEPTELRGLGRLGHAANAPTRPKFRRRRSPAFAGAPVFQV